MQLSVRVVYPITSLRVTTRAELFRRFCDSAIHGCQLEAYTAYLRVYRIRGYRATNLFLSARSRVFQRVLGS